MPGVRACGASLLAAVCHRVTFDDWLARYPKSLEVDPTQELTVMSGTDKAKNKAQDVGGKAKEAVGKVTGDKDTRDKGKSDQAKSSLKDAGEKVKDAFKK
jgi:uncharacterized protein YjbJ (UPF0337 family)